ncbi:hypothetical protein ACFL56_00055 [Candidatus Margulisiibacteriota bacterium]
MRNLLRKVVLFSTTQASIKPMGCAYVSIFNQILYKLNSLQKNYVDEMKNKSIHFKIHPNAVGSIQNYVQEIVDLFKKLKDKDAIIFESLYNDILIFVRLIVTSSKPLFEQYYDFVSDDLVPLTDEALARSIAHFSILADIDNTDEHYNNYLFISALELFTNLRKPIYYLKGQYERGNYLKELESHSFKEPRVDIDEQDGKPVLKTVEHNISYGPGHRKSGHIYDRYMNEFAERTNLLEESDVLSTIDTFLNRFITLHTLFNPRATIDNLFLKLEALGYRIRDEWQRDSVLKALAKGRISKKRAWKKDFKLDFRSYDVDPSPSETNFRKQTKRKIHELERDITKELLAVFDTQIDFEGQYRKVSSILSDEFQESFNTIFTILLEALPHKKKKKPGRPSNEDRLATEDRTHSSHFVYAARRLAQEGIDSSTLANKFVILAKMYYAFLTRFFSIPRIHFIDSLDRSFKLTTYHDYVATSLNSIDTLLDHLDEIVDVRTAIPKKIEKFNKYLTDIRNKNLFYFEFLEDPQYIHVSDEHTSVLNDNDQSGHRFFNYYQLFAHKLETVRKELNKCNDRFVSHKLNEIIRMFMRSTVFSHSYFRNLQAYMDRHFDTLRSEKRKQLYTKLTNYFPEIYDLSQVIFKKKEHDSTKLVYSNYFFDTYIEWITRSTKKLRESLEELRDSLGR